MKKLITALTFLFFASTASAQFVTETLLYETEFYQIIQVKEAEKEYIRYVGDIVQFTTYNLGVAFKNTGLDTLYIDSYGGIAIESYDLGNYLKYRNISVVVDTNANCVSACAFAVAIQDNLEIRNETGLLFHLPYTLGMPLEMSLNNFRKEGNMMLSYTISYLMQNRFSLGFVRILVEESYINEYIAIKSVSDLNDFKVSNDLDNALGEYQVIIMR